MKARHALLIMAIAAVSGGCANTMVATKYGREFDTTKIAQLQKGVTTVAQVLDFFGEPVVKHVTGVDGEIWVYSDVTVNARFTDNSFSREVNQSSLMKRLELLIRNGVIEAFTFTTGPAAE